MTMLGAIAAMITFILAGLPADFNPLTKLIIGGINAFLIFYLGKTNSGSS